MTRLFKSDEMEELGYLKQAKGKKANKVIRSEAFWKNVDIAVNYFEPLANVLRRMDSINGILPWINVGGEERNFSEV